VSVELLKFILENAEGYEVAVPWEGNRYYEPLCGFYSLKVLEKMGEFIGAGNHKLPDLFEEISINRLIINEQQHFYNKNLFLNINSKNDLEHAELLIRNKK
jgi:molybdopterin-guanine dinucleotide biosynthesis protein A